MTTLAIISFALFQACNEKNQTGIYNNQTNITDKWWDQARILEKLKKEKYFIAKKDFGDYVAQNQKLQKYPKDTPFGRWIRSMRYYKNTKIALQSYAPDIKFLSLQGLHMVEGEGNTASINRKDWWAGLLHIQPDVAKKDFNMKIFTDHKDYKQYDYDYLRTTHYNRYIPIGADKKQTAQWESKLRAYIYALHGNLLHKITNENDSQRKLADLDDRFNPQICLNKAAQRMQTDYTKTKEILDDQTTWPKEIAFQNYVTNTIQWDLYQYAAINAFNKWRSSFRKIKTTQSPRHMENVRDHSNNADKYHKILQKGINKWLSWEKLWKYTIQQIKPKTLTKNSIILKD